MAVIDRLPQYPHIDLELNIRRAKMAAYDIATVQTSGFLATSPAGQEQHLLAKLLDTLQSARQATLILDAILSPVPQNVGLDKGEQPSISDVAARLGCEVAEVAVRLQALKDRLGGYL